jgi:hypothetical protein
VAATTLIEEGRAAATGTWSLLRGRHTAADWFDFSTRGLAGSFIAFVLAVGINAMLPDILGNAPEDSSTFEALVMVVILYAVQVAAAALALRQMGRLDGLVPYLVADNWATFFITSLSIVMALLRINGDFALLILGVLVIIVEINIARLVVTLRVMQIVMFLVAQLVGVAIALMFIGALLPPSPVTG